MIPIAGLLLLTAALYARTLGYGYLTWDDPIYVTSRPELQALAQGDISGLGALLSPRAALAGHFWEFYPLRDLSYGLEVLLAGFSAPAMHLTNIILHLLTTLLVFVLARRHGLSLATAAMGAAVFGLHPLAVEPVAWISGRKDLLYALFCLWAMVLIAPSPTADPPMSRLRQLLLIGVALASFASKGPGMVVVPLLALGLFMRTDRQERRGVWTPVILLAAAASGWGLLMMHIGRLNALLRGPAETGWQAVFVALGAPLSTATRIVLPLELSPAKVPTLVPWYGASTSWLTIALLLLGAALLWRKRLTLQQPLFFAGAFALAVIPTSGIVAVAQAGSERFAYLPLAFFSLFVASAMERWAMPRLATRRDRLVALAGCVAVLALFARQSHGYVDAWKDDATLWKYVAARNPDNPVANGALGAMAMQQGHFPLAERLLRRSLKRAPNHATTWTNLGLLSLYRIQAEATAPAQRQRLLRQARHAFEYALRSAPDHPLALHGMGRTHELSGDEKAAETYFRRGAAAPREAMASTRALAELLWRSGRKAEAKAAVKRHGQRFPADRETLERWGSNNLR